MKKSRLDQDTAIAKSPQAQQQALVAQALKLPGVEEAFAVYNQALNSLPSIPLNNGTLYATDVNSAAA